MKEEKDIPYPFELFGVECNKGWYDILTPIFDYVEEYNKDKEEDAQIKFLQIKEKFAGLRVYTNFVTKELDKLIEEAEEKSYETCEDCGSTTDVGTRLNGWLTTMCLECVKKEAEHRNHPQVWERNSDNKKYDVFPNGEIKEK